jgi:glyoxylase-like metal-dependent hydrolase (beta-lactamase superfamily II)
VVDGDRITLIDNGIGDKQGKSFLKHYLLNGDDTLAGSLKNCGFSFDDITDVVLTHLHFDHCGGSIKYDEEKNLVPAFKNANFWVSKKQWELAKNPNRREKASFLEENILPIGESGKLKLVEGEEEIIPNITAKIFDGHTVGQIIPYINYNGKTIAYMADLLPSTAHIPMPYIMSYDTQPLLTLNDKERFYKDALDGNFILFFEHDIKNECCTLKNTIKGARVDKIFKLEDI